MALSLLIAGGVTALCASGVTLFAAPSLTGKTDTFQTNIPNVILLDAETNSVLFERNADQPIAPASLAKLMTLEYVFDQIKKGRLKLTDQFTISENAWRKGGAPSRGTTMFAPIHSQVGVGDLIQGIIVDFRQ